MNYINPTDFKDKNFTELVINYQKATQDLENYLDLNSKEVEDEINKL